jgi:predicted amidohydrolase
VLTLAVAQPRCVPYDVAANALIHAETVLGAGVRVVVFPELSLTGYELDAPTLDVHDPVLLPLIAACAETGSVALAGAPVRGLGHRPNIAMLAVTGEGATVAYRKLWLGSSETERFSGGDAPAVLDIDGLRLGLAICKDTGVRRHATDTTALGIDAYVAGTLMADSEADIQNDRGWQLARDHGVWVAFASFAGATGDGYDRACGRSGIWAPGGGLEAQAGPEVGAVVTATMTGLDGSAPPH